MRSRGIRLLGLVALTALMLPGGCPLYSLPAALPSVLKSVYNHSSTYSTAESDALRAVTPGTILDDVETLDGCWGAFEGIDPPKTGRNLRMWQALHFDPDSGTLTRYVVQKVFGFIETLDIQIGTYELNDDGSAFTFTVTKIESNLPSGEIADVTDDYETLPVYTVDVTRSGTRLLLQFNMPQDDPRTPAGFLDEYALIHKVFDCPSD
ncbi:MAG: hypothetical protein PVJ57_14490 [Phycisphaerae bacterium]|jgi:hypothetical protein